MASVTIATVTVTLIACAALVGFTTAMRAKVDDLVLAGRVDLLANEIEKHAIAHMLETSPAGRTLSEARGRRLLALADEVAHLTGDRQKVDALRPYLDALDAEFPQLVICDVEMPVLGGPAMLYRMFVENLGRENIPTIMVSGAAGLREIAAELGTRYFLTKPFGVKAFIDVVDRALAEAIPPRPTEQHLARA